MEEKLPPKKIKIELPEPNPVTRTIHRQDFFRRVTLPLIVGLALLVAAAAAFTLLPVGDVAAWSQIASILLIGLTMLLSLAALAILGGLVYFVSYLLRLLPPYTRMAQDGIEKIKENVEKGANIPAKPIIQVQSFIAAINALFRRK